MKATIEINGMHFHSRHGCLPQEREKGGEYIVDFSCLRDITDAASSDELWDTTDYSEIYGIISEQMQTPSSLLEHIAVRISDAVTENFPELEDVVVKVTKLNPPLDGPVDSSSVTVKK